MNKQIQAVKPVSASSKVSTTPASKPVAKPVQATKQASKTTTTTTAQKPASKPASPQASPLIIACRLIDKATVKFFSNTVASPSKHHYGRFSIDKDGNLAVTKEGLVFFSNRQDEKTAKAVSEKTLQAINSNKPLKSGECGKREWLANQAMINNKPVALPVFSGAGDANQQFAFAYVITQGNRK